MGMMGVLSLKVVGNITLLAIIVALLILNVISLVMPLFMKNNDDLASLATRLYIKDTKEFEGPIENKEEVKNEETNSGRDSEQ